MISNQWCNGWCTLLQKLWMCVVFLQRMQSGICLPQRGGSEHTPRQTRGEVTAAAGALFCWLCALKLCLLWGDNCSESETAAATAWQLTVSAVCTCKSVFARKLGLLCDYNRSVTHCHLLWEWPVWYLVWAYECLHCDHHFSEFCLCLICICLLCPLLLLCDCASLCFVECGHWQEAWWSLVDRPWPFVISWRRRQDITLTTCHCTHPRLPDERQMQAEPSFAKPMDWQPVAVHLERENNTDNVLSASEKNAGSFFRYKDTTRDNSSAEKSVSALPLCPLTMELCKDQSDQTYQKIWHE